MAYTSRSVYSVVRQKLSWLSRLPAPAARAMLAELRRGAGKAPGATPGVFQATLDGLPEELWGKPGKPSHGELAVHTALTLFAVHQQGRQMDTECMDKETMSLGKALRALVSSSEDEERIKRRLDAAATSGSIDELSQHLRAIVQLLRAAGVPLDYPALAEDIYRFQSPAQRDSVRLSWGQQFYRIKAADTNEQQKG